MLQSKVPLIEVLLDDPDVIWIVPGDSLGSHLYNWIEKLANLMAGWKTLFLICDIIAYKTLDK